MNMLMNLVLAVQILTALVMIGLVLVQHGKGADMGASFGSGASGSLFGATGSANFLSRSTAVLRRACSSSARWRWPTCRQRPRRERDDGSVLDRAGAPARRRRRRRLGRRRAIPAPQPRGAATAPPRAGAGSAAQRRLGASGAAQRMPQQLHEDALLRRRIRGCPESHSSRPCRASEFEMPPTW